MKAHKILLTLGILTFSATGSSAADDERLGATRVLAGGRNAPTIITVAPAKQSLLVKRATVPRTEVLAGGRNAPHQVRPTSEAIQFAPAVRKQK